MPRCLKPLARGLFLLGLLATPAMAQEELNGYPITDVNLRAGPGTEYPLLVTVPTDAPITILGCLEDYTWCDTIFEQYRGWMRSIYLAGYYDGEYYLLSDYAPDLGYQVLTFDRAAYWDAYYQDEPFYDDRSRVTEARGEDWVDDGVFYDRLSPHGSWTWTQGQYVWVPTGVDAGWRPYTRGRWVYTDHGWTWASDEPFGWATYHYGRWGFSNRIGWFWVPGNRWGTAWVSWRQSDDYLAWAPLPPAYDRGLNVNVSFGNIPGYYWSVVPSLYFLSDDLPRHYVRDRARWRSAYDHTRPIGHTTIVNKTVVNTVVNVNYVERHTNTKVVERQVRRTRDWDRAGKIRGDDYEVYRHGLPAVRGRHRPDKPRDIDDVAKESKTRGLARGEVATDDLLAPPEVREALKKRKGGRVRGEDSVRGAATVRGEVSVRGKDSGPSARSPGKTRGSRAGAGVLTSNGDLTSNGGRTSNGVLTSNSAAFSLLQSLPDLRGREQVVRRHLAARKTPGLALLGDVVDVPGLIRPMAATAFLQSGAINFVIVAADLASPVPVTRASDLSLDNLRVGVSLHVIDVDHGVHDRLVDNGGVSDRSGAIVGAAPTGAIADVVARQIV